MKTIVKTQTGVSLITGMSVQLTQPDDARLVILQDVDSINGVDAVVTTGARCRNGRWVGEDTGEDFTDQLSPRAVWSESFLFLPSSADTN